MIRPPEINHGDIEQQQVKHEEIYPEEIIIGNIQQPQLEIVNYYRLAAVDYRIDEKYYNIFSKVALLQDQSLAPDFHIARASRCSITHAFIQ